MTLLRLKLRNFKGIKDFEFRTSTSVDIYGANEAGKSSVGDAFTWLLFGKDMQDRTEAKFGIKTRENGVVRNHLEHEVSGTFLHVDREFTLRRVYAETWTRKRGTDKDELTGHTTSYFIDDAPVSKGEYTNFIASIIDESKFKMLTVPNYFAETLEWKERRTILSQIVGDIDDLAVIASDDSLSDYHLITKNLSHDQAKARVREHIKLTKEQLETIPARIDEAERQIVKIEDVDLLDIKRQKAVDEIAELRAVIEAPKSAPVELPHATEIRETREKLDALKESRRVAYEAWHENRSNILDTYRKEMNKNFEKSDEHRQSVQQLERSVRDAQSQLDEMLAKQQQLTKSHDEVAETCPACRQALPKEEIDDARHAFAEQKKAVSAKIAELSAVVNSKKTAKQIEDANKEIALLRVENEKLEAEKTTHFATAFDDTPYNSDTLNARLEELKKLNDAFLSKLTAEAPTYIAEREKITELTSAIQSIDTQLAQLAQNKKSRARVEELEILRQQSSSELVALERQQFILESFERVKATLMTKSVNELFNGVEFILFRDYISGGLEPCCDVVYKGVPYSEGLNTAGRIQAGIEIINALARHFGVVMPIIVDNRESVTTLPQSDAQIISLIVSPSHKNLTVS